MPACLLHASCDSVSTTLQIVQDAQNEIELADQGEGGGRLQAPVVVQLAEWTFYGSRRLTREVIRNLWNDWRSWDSRQR